MSENTKQIVGMAKALNYPDPAHRPWWPELPMQLVMSLSADVNYENRFTLSDEQLEAYSWIIEYVRPLSVSPKILYRAQVGVLTSLDGLPDFFDSISEMEVDTAELSLSGRKTLSDSRMMPNRRFVTSGRVNAESICVLYCASDENTAILECRAPVGSAVTVATMQNQSVLRVADLTEREIRTPPIGIEGFKERLHQCIAKQFSKRVVGNSAKYEYTLTQHISEQLKQRGYDGIIYSSSQSDTGGVNYAFFDPTNFEFISKTMYNVDRISVSFSELQPTEKMKFPPIPNSG